MYKTLEKSENNVDDRSFRRSKAGGEIKSTKQKRINPPRFKRPCNIKRLFRLQRDLTRLRIERFWASTSINRNAV